MTGLSTVKHAKSTSTRQVTYIMKPIIIALLFIAIFFLSGVVSDGNAVVQMAAVVLFGLVIVWHAMKVICCACGQGDKPGCSKYRIDKIQ